MNIAVVIVSFNTSELLDKCLNSILSQKWKNNVSIWVIDNHSLDNSVGMAKNKYKQVKLIENRENLGFAKANNQALSMINSGYYLLLNSDTRVTPGSIDHLAEFLDQYQYGIGSCKLLNTDNTFQPNAGDLPFSVSLLMWLSGLDDIIQKVVNSTCSFHQKSPKYYASDREVGWVGGTAMMIKKEVIDKIGVLDPNIFMYGEDVEYCLRAKKAGFRIGWTKGASIIHLGGGSSKDPQMGQWVGEFKGLLYIYQKYLGRFYQVLLKALIYFFVILRITAFFITGRFSISKTYAKVLFNI